MFRLQGFIQDETTQRILDEVYINHDKNDQKLRIAFDGITNSRGQDSLP